MLYQQHVRWTSLLPVSNANYNVSEYREEEYPIQYRNIHISHNFEIFAVPPSAVQLKIGENFKPSTYEVKMSKENKGKTVVDVECVAAAARPAPKFKWFLGGDELSVSITIIIFRYIKNNISISHWRYNFVIFI